MKPVLTIALLLCFACFVAFSLPTNWKTMSSKSRILYKLGAKNRRKEESLGLKPHLLQNLKTSDVSSAVREGGALRRSFSTAKKNQLQAVARGVASVLATLDPAIPRSALDVLRACATETVYDGTALEELDEYYTDFFGHGDEDTDPGACRQRRQAEFDYRTSRITSYQLIKIFEATKDCAWTAVDEQVTPSFVSTALALVECAGILDHSTWRDLGDITSSRLKQSKEKHFPHMKRAVNELWGANDRDYAALRAYYQTRLGKEMIRLTNSFVAFKMDTTDYEVPTAPAAWTASGCDFEDYDAGFNDGCDCGCSIRDPDCDFDGVKYFFHGSPISKDQCTSRRRSNVDESRRDYQDYRRILEKEMLSRKSSEKRSPEIKESRRSAPPEWTCDPSYYDAWDGCDCGCGIRDPDCEFDLDDIIGCNDGVARNCSDQGQCVYEDLGTYLPAGWDYALEGCDADYYNASDGCDCGCGAYDPDCTDPNELVLNCDGVPGAQCNPSGVCVSTITVPPEWTCDPTYYGTHDGCDCNCGAPDPDCNKPDHEFYEWEMDLVPFGCELGEDVQCIAGECVVNNPIPGNWTCAPERYNSSDGCDCGCGVHDPDCDRVDENGRPASFTTGCECVTMECIAGSCVGFCAGYAFAAKSASELLADLEKVEEAGVSTGAYAAATTFSILFALAFALVLVVAIVLGVLLVLEKKKKKEKGGQDVQMETRN